MKKVIVVLLIIAIILLGGYLYLDKYADNNNTNNTNNTNNNTSNLDQNKPSTSFNEDEEKEELNKNLESIRSSLGFIGVLNIISSEDSSIPKNKNLLGDTKSKQLFVMEQIVSNKENDKNFIILGSDGKLVQEEMSPTTDAITAYYPYNLFEKEYNKYFKEKFNIDEREKSYDNNSYDNDSKYIFYRNVRPGANGLNIANITVESISKTSSNKYSANITLKYSDRLSESLGVETEKAELIYVRDNGNIKIDSYLLK